jgi:putative membrane protein
MSIVTLVLLAAFAFASPQQQSDQQTSSTPQGTKNNQTTKTDKHDHAMKDATSSDAMQNASGALASDDRKFVMEAAHGGMMEVKMGRMAADKASNADVKAFGQRMVDDHSKANSELMSLASQKGITLPGAADMAMTDQSAASIASVSSTTQSSAQSSSPTSSTSSQPSSTTPATSDQKSSASSTTAGQSSMDTTASGPRHARVDADTGESLKDQEHMNKLSSLSGDAFDREYMNMMVKDHEKDVKEFEKASTKAKDADVRAFAAKTLPTLREHLQQARDIQSRVKGTKNASSTNKTSGQ